MKHIPIVFCWLIALVCLAGCSTPRIDLTMASLPNVNPDNSDRPSPVLIKTYELRTDLNFKQSDFQDLFERPIQTLGGDLIATDEMVLIPGEARKIAYHPNKETKFLGIVAGFRFLERAQWRIIKQINADIKNKIAIELNNESILLISDEKISNWNPEEAIIKFQQQKSKKETENSTQVSTTRGENASANFQSHRDEGYINIQTQKDKLAEEIESSSAIQDSAQASPPMRTMSQIH